MTPERAAYHLLMPGVGLWDEFDREFDEAPENEDPLSKLILDLTSHASDINGCISAPVPQKKTLLQHILESFKHEPESHAKAWDSFSSFMKIIFRFNYFLK